nr:MAG TPA: hypothetical protein [Caudoviricetes sp.]
MSYFYLAHISQCRGARRGQRDYPGRTDEASAPDFP